MKILGTNLLPFSVSQMPSNWTTGIEIEAYFFEGEMPADLSAYADHRNLIRDSVAVSRIVLKPTVEGLLLTPYSIGIKAVAGSIYDPKLGITKHYPTNIIPKKTTTSPVGTLDINVAYGVNVDTGNKKVKQHISLGHFPGFELGSQSQLMDYLGTMGNQISTSANLVFDSIKTFNACYCESTATNYEAYIIIASDSTAPGTSTPVAANVPVPIGVTTHEFPASIQPVLTDILNVTGGNTGLRRVIPCSKGNTGNVTISKTIGHAILVIPDSNNGSLAVGNYDIRLMCTKVGLKDSGELIELESLTLSTGEFAEIINVRTGTGALKDNPSAWVHPDAVIAFDRASILATLVGDTFTDYKGNPFVIQANRPIALYDDGFNFYGASSTLSFDFQESHYAEIMYRSLDPSKEVKLQLITHIVQEIGSPSLYRNSFGFGDENTIVRGSTSTPQIVRKFNAAYNRIKSKEWTNLVLQYNKSTGTHTVYYNGELIDTFTFVVSGIDPFGRKILYCQDPDCVINNYQIVPGLKY